jgi:phosphotransferase system  glucose/maltose/N-acetylglucosamine-specific IIC component
MTALIVRLMAIVIAVAVAVSLTDELHTVGALAIGVGVVIVGEAVLSGLAE